jgi:F-type H+-transporting ATPase subunit gamma
MVSAAKLKVARPFGEAAQAFFVKAEVTVPEDAKNKILIGISSDRGLCGGIHTSISKLIRVIY